MRQIDSVWFLIAASGLGSGRVVPTVAAAVGLVGVVLGGLALKRSAKGVGRLGAAGAAVAGLISLSVGGLHAANSAGGVGTGNGLAGARVAIALGLIAVILGGVSWYRSHPCKLSARPRE
jgi:hypothetical protein